MLNEYQLIHNLSPLTEYLVEVGALEYLGT